MLLLSDYYRCASAEHIFRSNLANARVPPKSTAVEHPSRNADKNILPKKGFYMYARSVQQISICDLFLKFQNDSKRRVSKEKYRLRKKKKWKFRYIYAYRFVKTWCKKSLAISSKNLANVEAYLIVFLCERNNNFDCAHKLNSDDGKHFIRRYRKREFFAGRLTNFSPVYIRYSRSLNRRGDILRDVMLSFKAPGKCGRVSQSTPRGKKPGKGGKAKGKGRK